MAASLTALATVVWSDFAEAAAEPQVALADDVQTPTPVKVTKIQHRDETLDELLLEPMMEMPPTGKPGKPSRRRLDFGSFEGY